MTSAAVRGQSNVDDCHYAVLPCHYAVLPRLNRVAISDMTHCINSVLHAVDAVIVRVLCAVCFCRLRV